MLAVKKPAERRRHDDRQRVARPDSLGVDRLLDFDPHVVAPRVSIFSSCPCPDSTSDSVP
jgi:hypothetical protein